MGKHRAHTWHRGRHSYGVPVPRRVRLSPRRVAAHALGACCGRAARRHFTHIVKRRDVVKVGSTIAITHFCKTFHSFRSRLKHCFCRTFERTKSTRHCYVLLLFDLKNVLLRVGCRDENEIKFKVLVPVHSLTVRKLCLNVQLFQRRLNLLF